MPFIGRKDNQLNNEVVVVVCRAQSSMMSHLAVKIARMNPHGWGGPLPPYYFISHTGYLLFSPYTTGQLFLVPSEEVHTGQFFSIQLEVGHSILIIKIMCRT